ncbi:C-reactive protein-like [Hyperolius riggenbachi]|uniref:C-reactive protein-like n=1 Tax=Hyperolius riggenbachi TaxID=752182 RepID=UPI0035A32BA5
MELVQIHNRLFSLLLRIMKLCALLLLLLIPAPGSQAQQDLSGKVFLFPKQTSYDCVILKPKVAKPLEKVTVCLTSYSELSRNYASFSLATRAYDNTFLIFFQPPNVCSIHIFNEELKFIVDSEALNWKQTCVTWDSQTGVVQLWINGKLYPRKVSGKKFPIPEQSSIILAQDQDFFGGNFQDSRSFVGEISDVHMWDEVLSPEDLRKVLYGNHSGNLISWKSLRYEAQGNVLVQPKLQCRSWGYSTSQYTSCS